MKVHTMASAAVALAGSAVVAQESNTSAPFNLYIAQSSNSSFLGWILSACHASPAVEGLCVYNKGPFPPSTTFYHNTSEAYLPVSGPLFWNLAVPAPNNTRMDVQSPMSLSYVPWSNIAVPLLKPGYDVTTVGFDGDGKLFLVAFGDDRIHSPYDHPPTSEPRAMYNWYACWTYVGNYYYHALAWATVLPPQNPTCEAVNVTRTFIEPGSQTPKSAEPATALADSLGASRTAVLEETKTKSPESTEATDTSDSQSDTGESTESN